MYALLKPVWVAATSVISSRFTRSQLWPCCYAYHIGIYIPSGYVKITIENGPCSSWIYPLKMVVFHSYGTVYQTVSLFIIIQRYSPASLDGHGNPKLSAQWLEPKTCKNVLSLKIKKINKLKPLTYTTPHNHILPWCISGITIGYIMHIYIYTYTYVYIYIYTVYMLSTYDQHRFGFGYPGFMASLKFFWSPGTLTRSRLQKRGTSTSRLEHAFRRRLSFHVVNLPCATTNIIDWYVCMYIYINVYNYIYIVIYIHICNILYLYNFIHIIL